jgi:hypothetical protein
VVSLEHAPEGFAALITRTNNTQNRIDARNFVALDPEQERLRVEFAVDNIDYEYRQGEIESSSDNRIGLVEATIALACAEDDVELAVQAKREIGKLWEDITRAPYKKIFNGSRTCDDILAKVNAFRKVESAISAYQIKTSGKNHNISVHGNRLIFHIAYRRLLNSGSQADLSDLKNLN